MTPASIDTSKIIFFIITCFLRLDNNLCLFKCIWFSLVNFCWLNDNTIRVSAANFSFIFHSHKLLYNYLHYPPPLDFLNFFGINFDIKLTSINWRSISIGNRMCLSLPCAPARSWQKASHRSYHTPTRSCPPCYVPCCLPWSGAP